MTQQQIKAKLLAYWFEKMLLGIAVHNEIVRYNKYGGGVNIA